MTLTCSFCRRNLRELARPRDAMFRWLRKDHRILAFVVVCEPGSQCMDLSDAYGARLDDGAYWFDHHLAVFVGRRTSQARWAQIVDRKTVLATPAVALAMRDAFYQAGEWR